MADVVQYRLERMAAELEDLEQREIFSRREIAEIVKQRRKFEYRLKRPSPLKHDFIAYIDYETQLDSLRRLRKKSVARELKKLEIDPVEMDKKNHRKKKKKMKSVSDFAGVVRIAEIYRQAVTRYKGDVDLWFRYLEFCRQRRNGAMKKVLAKAIRFHTKVPGLWIYAAAWEFDHNLNAAAARALMQSGLRACPNSEDLWIEYLRMELTYLNKLKARKVALGEDEGTLTRDKKVAEDKQWRDENEDLFMSLNSNNNNGGGENDGATLAESKEEKVDVFREQGSNVLRTIYGGAIEALPSSFSLRKRFFEIMEAVDLANMEEIRVQMHSDMKRDFSTDPEYWVWLAKLEYDPEATEKMTSEDIMHSQIQKAIQVFEEAVEALPLVKMFDLYAKFLMGIIISPKEETEISRLSNQYETYVSRLLIMYEKAEKKDCLTEDLACQHVSFYLQLGRLDEARNLAEKLCGNFPDSISLLVLRASIEIKQATRNSASPDKADLSKIYGLVKDVLGKTSVLKAESLWLMALKIFSGRKEYFKKLVETSIVSLTKYGGSDDGFSLSSAIVNFIFQKYGIQEARDTYKRFLALPHPGLAIYRNCIELESNLVSVGDKDGLVNARKLYESALTTYSQNAILWQNFYKFETNMGTSDTASTVYWRARKILKDASALISLDV